MMTPNGMRQLLKLLGYHITLRPFPALAEPYTHLVVVQHVEDQDTVLFPIDINSDDDEVVAALLEPMADRIYVLGHILRYIGGSHDEPEIEIIRREKKKAIMNQDFERASGLRAQERALKCE